MAIVDALLLSIVDSVMFIKICEAAATSAICLLTYQTLKSLVPITHAQFVSSCLAAFPLIFLSPQMANNQVFSALFCVLALYLYVRLFSTNHSSSLGHLLRCSFIIGAIIGLARFIRPDAVLVLVAVVVSLLLANIAESRAPKASLIQRMPKILLPALSALAAFIVVTTIINTSLIVSGIAAEEPRGQNVTINKLLIGTDEETSGGWSNDYQIQNNALANSENVSYQEAALKTIADRMLNPKYLASLTIKKTQRLWWENSELFNLSELSDSVLIEVNAVEKTWVLLLVLANILFSFWLAWRARKIEYT